MYLIDCVNVFKNENNYMKFAIEDIYKPSFSDSITVKQR